MLNRFLRLLIVLALCASLIPATAFGQGNSGKGRGQHGFEHEDEDRGNDNARDNHGRDHQKGGLLFTQRDRDIIRNYFLGGNSNLPPGLAKRGGNLPPGLQKQLDRNGTLPPGLQKRLTPFPADLNRRLPTLPDIYRRGSIGSDVVILDTRTQRIVDVMHGILNR